VKSRTENDTKQDILDAEEVRQQKAAEKARGERRFRWRRGGQLEEISEDGVHSKV